MDNQTTNYGYWFLSALISTGLIWLLFLKKFGFGSDHSDDSESTVSNANIGIIGENIFNLMLVIKASDMSQLGFFKHEPEKVYSKGTAEDLIRKTIRAYAYQEGDKQGEENGKQINRSNEAIDYDSEERILVHLQVYATPEIIECNDTDLIRRALSSDRPIEIKEISKLAAKSGTNAFYDIM